MIPSRWEGFSFARLEAMSLKLPIIAFELDSLKENLCREPVISFVKPYNINELATKSISLLISSIGLFVSGAALGAFLLRFGIALPLVTASLIFSIALIPLMRGERPSA